MRKVIIEMSMSLNGFVAGSDDGKRVSERSQRNQACVRLAFEGKKGRECQQE